MFVTTAEFLPQHHQQRQQVLQIISAAEARGQHRLAEMNRQVLGNLDKIITALEAETDTRERRPRMRADNTAHLIAAASRRHELTRSKAIRALRELDAAGTTVTFESVARAAGVSRSWLYTQPDIRAEIERLRDLGRRAPGTPVPARQRSSPTPPCCAGWKPPTPATANWPRTTSGCATSSPKPSDSSAPPASAQPRAKAPAIHVTSPIDNNRPLLTTGISRPRLVENDVLDEPVQVRAPYERTALDNDRFPT